MSNFDGTVDNRWRPDFESSQRRVRDEESEPPTIYSRELSFVPARREEREPHDAQTQALIRRAKELARLPHGDRVGELLEKWKWMDRMNTPDQKQRFLEPLIETARRDPQANEAVLVFLMLAFEPVRRSVSSAFVRARSGLTPRQRDVDWGNRTEAALIRNLERQELYDVTREAALEAVFRYPSQPPDKFFPWLRETIAHRALDKLRGDLPQPEASGHSAAEAEAVQQALAGFDQATAPTLRDRRGYRQWRAGIPMRDVFEIVEAFFENDGVREACRAAVGRLPRGQQDVINGYFFDEVEVPDLAQRRSVSKSTIYNQKSKAQCRLRDDDVFFMALSSLGCVRDAARTESIHAAYPDGRLPDGRRIVVIDQAA